MRLARPATVGDQQFAQGIAGVDTKKAETPAQRLGELDASKGFLAQARIAEFRKDQARDEAVLRARD